MKNYQIKCCGCGCSDVLGTLTLPDDVDPTRALSGYLCAYARLDSISPTEGPKAGGTAVTLSGHRLNSKDITVLFGDKLALNPRNAEDGVLVVDTPEGLVAGNVTVTVLTSAGLRTSGGPATATFTYL